MRVSGYHRHRVLRTLSVFALSVGLSGVMLGSTGCAKRLTLTPAEFERIEKREQATEDLRVYVGKKLVVIYELDDDAASYKVDKNINTSSEQNILRVIIAKSTKGVIIDSEDKNGAPLLWVTFSQSCKDKDCAFGFVQTEDGVFRLTTVPERDGYKAPKPYFKRETKAMAHGKLKSLAEKNDVFLWKNPRGKIFTTDLIVKKRTDTKRRTETIRDGGIN